MRLPAGSRSLTIGLGGCVALALPPAREALEATLPGHMVAQIGLLAASGWWIGRGLGPLPPGKARDWNRWGITGLVTAAFALAFWMLPRTLDAALQDPFWEAGKLVSVPLLVGLPLARSWPRLPPVGRGLVWANAIPMLAVMGWIYHEAPGRLCNSYLIGQQDLLAWTLWALAILTAAAWTLRAFRGPGRSPGV